MLTSKIKERLTDLEDLFVDTGLPVTIVNNEKFRKAYQRLDPKFVVPGISNTSVHLAYELFYSGALSVLNELCKQQMRFISSFGTEINEIISAIRTVALQLVRTALFFCAISSLLVHNVLFVRLS